LLCFVDSSNQSQLGYEPTYNKIQDASDQNQLTLLSVGMESTFDMLTIFRNKMPLREVFWIEAIP
jgi:hypothetical protein